MKTITLNWVEIRLFHTVILSRDYTAVYTDFTAVSIPFWHFEILAVTSNNNKKKNNKLCLAMVYFRHIFNS